MEAGSGKEVAIARAGGPRLAPLTTNSAPWAMAELGSPGGMLVAAFSAAVMVGAWARAAAAVTIDRQNSWNDFIEYICEGTIQIGEKLFGKDKPRAARIGSAV